MKWGILGTANIALNSVMPAMKTVQGNTIIAIASRDKETANKAAKPFGIEGLGSYQALLEMDEIEAVYIPLPNSLHYEWVTKALQAGKHVLVEKSAFTSLEEAESAVALAKTQGCVIVENFQFQHHSQHRETRKLIEDGAIGSIRAFRASFGFPPFGGEKNIRYVKALGGGALLDAGAYTLKATTFLFGRRFRVEAAHLIHHPEYGVDWYGGAFLTDRSQGIFSEVTWGFDNFYQCNYEIWGSKGKLTSTRAYTAKPDHSPKIVLESEGRGIQELILNPDDHFHGMLAHFNAIVDDERFEAELADLVTQARLLEEVRKIAA